MGEAENGGWPSPKRQHRRRSGKRLAASARDFQALIEHARDFIVCLDRDRRFAFVSPACRRLGYEPEDLVGQLVDVLIHPDERESAVRTFNAVMNGAPLPADQAYEHRILTRGGEFIWVEGAPQVVPGPDGRPTGIISQLRDVTARRAAQVALAESEARFRLLADRATDIIVTTDAAGTILYISPACRLMGYTAEEMVGRPAVEFIHPADHEVTAERTRRLLAGVPRPPSERREYRALVKGGGVIWLEGASSVNRDETCQVIDVVSHMRDVTERRRMEDELLRKHAEAEAATLAKSEFLANMSHEIRTPLTGILGFAGLLEERDDLPVAARAQVSRIAAASRALLTVVNDILDFSKIEAGQIELDPQPFHPASFLEDAVALVAPQAEAKGLSIRTIIEAPLPEAVSADGARLRQVLLNLLTNAVKFTEKGGVAVSLAHDPTEGGRLKFAVADTGIGIAPERVGRLFQRFSQADGSISRQYGGTGLGLAIARSLTELMGGLIAVESAPGQGSTFSFHVEAPACDPVAATAGQEAQGPFDARPSRILVVDDSPVNRELVGALLSVFGHDLTEAGGGAEAVEAAAQRPFDLILMDLQMPGMDGLAATRAIRAACPLNRATPIVALSANILPTHLEACARAGMDDHIGKPIDTRELLTKVARWTVERSHAAEAAA